MPEFTYTAINMGGTSSRGKIRAADKASALEAVIASGLTPTHIQEATARSQIFDWLKYKQKDFTPADAGHFSGDLHRLLHSGFSMRQALDVIAISAETKAVKTLAKDAADQISKGGRLSYVIEEAGGSTAVALSGLVRAGEMGGNLEDILASAAASFQKGAEFREKITSALIYPAIIGFLISMTLILFFSFILPQLEPLFAGAEDKLPRSTQFLLAFGRFFEMGLPLMLLGLVGLIMAARFIPGISDGLKKTGGRVALSRMSGGVSRLTNYATYARIMSLLIGSGVPAPNAHMISAQACSNALIKSDLLELSQSLREGRALAKCLEPLPRVPELLTNMTRVGESSGKLSAALGDAADILERRAARRMERLLAALTPMITIVLGLIVAVVVGALFMGISSLTDVSAF